MAVATIPVGCGCVLDIDPNHDMGERVHRCCHGHQYAVAASRPRTVSYAARLIRAAEIDPAGSA